MTDKEKIQKALQLIIDYCGIDGDHHKTWVLDQVTRVLADEQYDVLVADACNGEDGPNTYTWDTGIAP